MRFVEARQVREALTPIRTQSEVAKILEPLFGKRVTKARIEQIELRALQKILNGFRAERGRPVDLDAELTRLRLLEKNLWRRLNSGLTSGPKSE